MLVNNQSQHNQLATTYVNTIATALEEFQPGLPTQYYKDLAWGGLEGTIPYDLLPIDTKRRIDSVNYAEATNTTVQEYNPSGVFIATHVPKGHPCP